MAEEAGAQPMRAALTIPNPDPITAILLTVTEMRGMLLGALEDLKRTERTVDELGKRGETNQARIIALETRAGPLEHRVDELERRPRGVGTGTLVAILTVGIAAVAAFAALLGHVLAA